MINIPNKISIHVTDTPDDMDIGAIEIEEWHSKPPFSFKDQASGKSIGYTYVIRRDGTIEAGRPESSVPAAVKGYNTNSIAIAWVGRNEMTVLQVVSLANLVLKLIKKHGIRIEMVLGHKEFPLVKKTCPNISMNMLRLYIRQMEGFKNPDYKIPVPPKPPRNPSKMSFWRKIKFIFFS